jgi:hypothetical protein
MGDTDTVDHISLWTLTTKQEDYRALWVHGNQWALSFGLLVGIEDADALPN